MAHGLNSTIKREIDCGHHNSISVINKLSGLVGNSAATTSVTAVTAAATAPAPINMNSHNNNNNNTSNSNSSASHSGAAAGAGNARMGSRRIFTPQFKLQVLESYRCDSECKGNQRATARKYGIHRRQIQKWLQSESTLRESVANYNSQNTVRNHQFHNITHHQMTISSASATTTGPISSGAIGATASATSNTATTMPGQAAAVVNMHTMSGGAYVHNNNNNNNPLHHHHRHNHQQQPPPYKTALDTARHSVALIHSPPTATVRLNPVVAVAPQKCMNGLPLTPATLPPTNTMSMLPTAAAYSQTPAAIKPVPVLIQRQHQSPLHQHHHHHHHHPQLHQQHHESVLMSSACLPDSEYSSPPSSSMGAIQAHYENLHRPQAVYDYMRPYHPPQPVVVAAPVPTPGAPIDLSVGARRPPHSPTSPSSISSTEVAKWYQVPETNNNDHEMIKTVKIEPPMSPIACSTPNPSQAVDLTCRKRPNHSSDPSTPPEKLPKTDDAAAPAKPVKLFKPYLPDNEDPVPEMKPPSASESEQQDAIIWSNHPAAPANKNFQSPASDSAYTFPLGSPCSNSGSLCSSGSKFQSPTSPVLSPHSPSAGSSAAPGTPNSMWCPKGSPVSGYETASTYSDSSEHHRFAASHHPGGSAFEPRGGATYSLDVKMEAALIDARFYQPDLTRGGVDETSAIGGRSAFTSQRQHHEVQRWLMEQHLATTNSKPTSAIPVYV